MCSSHQTEHPVFQRHLAICNGFADKMLLEVDMLGPRTMGGILSERDGPLVVAIDDRGSESQRRSGGDDEST